MQTDPLTTDEQIDEWKLSEEFENLLHGDELLSDFDRSVTSIVPRMDTVEDDQ